MIYVEQKIVKIKIVKDEGDRRTVVMKERKGGKLLHYKRRNGDTKHKEKIEMIEKQTWFMDYEQTEEGKQLELEWEITLTRVSSKIDQKTRK